MNRDLLDTVNDISTSLAILAQQVRSEAAAGLGSRNKMAEHVLLPVLRRVYSAPDLVNTNALAPNFPGIDLYDPSSFLGVQVTSDTDSSKITETIGTLAAGDLQLSRLVIALAADTKPRYQAKTRAKWKTATESRFEFDPEADVLAFDRLLLRIQALPPSEIVAIAAELEALVRGKHVLHLLPHLRRQVEAQIAEEQRVARYIPDIFVETQNMKYQARCFAHPALFARRIAGWFDRQPFAGVNHLAAMSGVPPLNAPSTAALGAANTLQSAAETARTLFDDLGSFDEMLALYSKIGSANGAGIPRDESRVHMFDATRVKIEMGAGAMRYQVQDRRTELHCVTSQILLITGPAGQGKTNFLCDFADRFLLRHGIPSAYVTTRQLSRIPHPYLTEVLCQLIFPSTVSRLEEGLSAVADACNEQRQPFVLIIDGLNEHPDIRVFAGQLEHLLETLVRYPHVRVLMACRSEFLEARFGGLLSGHLAPVLHLSEAHGQRIDNKQFRELVTRYFRFFRVRPSLVSKRVIEFLQRDVLLLRFFCEAYGARGRDREYRQPFISGVYREEIFRRYVEDKLTRAQQAVVNDRSTTRPLVGPAKVRRVLSAVAAHMIETGCYADVPRRVVPAALDGELTALLDEELVLRNDLGPATSLLASPPEVLNFTFDEMRDFILAQYLLGVYAQDVGEFDRLVALQEPSTTQSIEGLQRFLFYASRVPTNNAFFQSYQTHPWYAAVYDTEIFAVPPTHLDGGDRRIAETALVGGGNRARHFAQELALRWDSSTFPVLNLEVLTSVARRADSSFFEEVIVPTFGRSSYHQDSLGEAFCRFVEKEIGPTFSLDENKPYEPIFRLLLLLLPVNASPTLDSPALVLFRQIVAAQPTYALGLLREALEDGSRKHRPFLWRLLSATAPTVLDRGWFVAAAEADLADPNSDPVLCREAEWFLTRVSATWSPS